MPRLGWEEGAGVGFAEAVEEESEECWAVEGR